MIPVRLIERIQMLCWRAAVMIYLRHSAVLRGIHAIVLPTGNFAEISRGASGLNSGGTEVWREIAPWNKVSSSANVNAYVTGEPPNSTAAPLKDEPPMCGFGPTAALPVWMSALALAPCTVHDDAGTHAIRWQFDSEAVYFVATATPQILQPFGITLAKGEVATIRWLAGATDPTVEVHQSRAARAATPR
jgi:hypothetical protein